MPRKRREEPPWPQRRQTEGKGVKYDDTDKAGHK
jgi:hypothetical protein